MILRSVTKHVRDQNWFAVGLDFLIVVVGVFIGIQVANWNEARLERTEEAILIERIRADFARIDDDAERSLGYHQTMASDLKTMVRVLRTGMLGVEDQAAFERALFLGLAFQTSADHSGTFTEMLSSGRANILRDKALLNELVAYQDFLDRFAVARSYFVDMALGVQEPFTAGFDFDIDAAFFTDPLQLNTQAPTIAAYDFEDLVADPTFHNAAEQLLFMHSLYTMWRMRINGRIDKLQRHLAGTQQ